MEIQFRLLSGYAQLDASFRLVAPYCYCCVNNIYNNEFVTIAVIVGTSESAELCDNVYQVMESSGISGELLHIIPVLSGHGSDLAAFCERRGLRHCLCHRHFLEGFGHTQLGQEIVRVSCHYYEIVSTQIFLEITRYLGE